MYVVSMPSDLLDYNSILPYFNDHFSYDDESGSCTRIKVSRGSSPVGSVVGGSGSSHIKISHNRNFYLLHRIIFLKLHGHLPQIVDHINRNCRDNSASNLRGGSKTENNYNVSSQEGSSSKYLGVTWDKSRGKWISGIKVNYKRVNLGRFNDEKEAAKAYDKAAIMYRGEWCNLNFPPAP